jgi:hypothetical protein
MPDHCFGRQKLTGLLPAAQRRMNRDCLARFGAGFGRRFCSHRVTECHTDVTRTNTLAAILILVKLGYFLGERDLRKRFLDLEEPHQH